MAAKRMSTIVTGERRSEGYQQIRASIDRSSPGHGAHPSRAGNTPGHTKGATTWMTTLVDSGKAYHVVFPDGAGFNPGYQIANPEEYLGINQDYRATLHFLETLRPDIWLGHHTEYFDLEGKRTHASEGAKAWVDPEGYRRWVAGKRRAFEDEVDREMGVKPREKGPVGDDPRNNAAAGCQPQLAADEFQGDH